MRKEYEMVTVREYVNAVDKVRYTSVSEVEIEREVERYILNQKRYETNAKIVEALLA